MRMAEKLSGLRYKSIKPAACFNANDPGGLRNTPSAPVPSRKSLFFRRSAARHKPPAIFNANTTGHYHEKLYKIYQIHVISKQLFCKPVNRAI